MQLKFRKNQRYKTLKPATIVSKNGKSVVDCTLRNISDSGAQLELKKAVHMSSQFNLILKFEKKAVTCDATWREGNLVGVAFLSNLKPLDTEINYC